MSEFFYRTEDIPRQQILDLFVSTTEDRRIVDALKSRNPTVLVGSRGVGKSFLLRVAESELGSDPGQAFPVYVTFNRASLIHTGMPHQFQHWMLALICSRILRALKKQGLVSKKNSAASILAAGSGAADPRPRIDEIVTSFENSWRRPGNEVDVSSLPGIDAFRDAIEDICDQLGIPRFAVFFDEAAHIFRPDQQRAFFSLFRDLRSPYLTCNAAVYPGVTSFGDAFQPVHDATFLSVDRDVLSSSYIENMREIVAVQADAAALSAIARRGQNFAVLAYAASGNPRLLLKTVAQAPKMHTNRINEVLKEHYRTDVWAEHSGLAEKYPGHRPLVDWGRTFLEHHVLTELQAKNEKYLEHDSKTAAHFWIHRDAPESVRESLRLLAYTGIVSEDTPGIRATRGEIGTRYRVNLGTLIALESAPATSGFQIASNIDLRRMSEFGANHGAYESLIEAIPVFEEGSHTAALDKQLTAGIDRLDVTEWQKTKLRELGLATVGDVLRGSEEDLKRAYYVGDKRARQMWNASVAAVLEYLSG